MYRVSDMVPGRMLEMHILESSNNQ